LSARRFGSEIDLAAMLFTAHNLALGARDMAAAQSGAPPGEATGPTASKTVGPVSASFDTAATAIDGAGAWNATSYGQRLYTLMRKYSLGMIYSPGPRRGAYPGPIYGR
jgi:hypothetical protein